MRSTTPNDPDFGDQWHHVDGSDNDIDSDLAWDITTGGTTMNGDEIVVCVIEGGGADWDHPDLLANHWINTLEIEGNLVDDDGNGYVDDYHGWNSGNNTDNIMPGGHGTQVSGMIGAVGDNANNVSGINWDVKIMQVDMSGTITEASVIEAYTYPLTMRQLYTSSGGTEGAFVVATNASWGIDNADAPDYPLWCNFYNTLGYAGILNCGATANNNVNIDVVGDMPTTCASPYMISVTATNSSDVRTFAGYGQTSIDLGAPGSAVYTTSNGGGNGSTSGTSFASPLTAGVIALLYSTPCQTLADYAMSDPQIAANIVRNALLNGVDPVANLASETVTGGRLNAYNSVLLIQAGCADAPCTAVATSTSVNTCPAPCDGEISIDVTGGGTYAYDLGEGPQPGSDFTGLCGGNYSVNVNDLNLCVFQLDVTVGTWPGMNGSSVVTDELAGNDGAIDVTVTGGTPPYVYDWNGPGAFSASSEDLTGIAGGDYELTITDDNGCTLTMTTIAVPSSVGIAEGEIMFSIYPNPANGSFTLALPDGENVTLKLYDVIGNVVLTQSASKTTVVNCSALAKGTYVFTVTNQQGAEQNGKLVIE